MLKLKLFVFIAITAVLFSCEESSSEADSNTGTIKLHFDNVVGEKGFEFEPILGADKIYTNKAGEEYSLSKVQYFISNIELVNVEGGTYTIPVNDSYFLVKEEVAATQMFELSMIPEGTYKSLRFMVGVDSARNVSENTDDFMGVLDKGNPDLGGDMYWNWNAGYIHFKMEGNSSVIEQENNAQKKFLFHVGGFGGYDKPTANNTRVVELPLMGTKISSSVKPTLHIVADLEKVMGGNSVVSLAATPTVHMPNTAVSANLADNYASMFMIHHQH